ncbi:NADP-dependent leukotriene B4 12-hydroxydehydrogenase [Mariannaea sp. PMI_226]|nr:NADP-dependent leukotriene B4 12-hydroxydehydrogenase [Mariannaea sp. PMI_226]
MTCNKTLIYKKIPSGLPIPGVDLAVENLQIDLNNPPQGGLILDVLQASFDPYLRGRMRNPNIKATLPCIKKYARVEDLKSQMVRKINNPCNFDVDLFLGPLGMPGLTAWSGLYKIGKPKKGETIFISSVAGAVGQVVGQIAMHEGLAVIGLVGSDEKLDFIMNELGFDSGFNYKRENPMDALKRLAPNGIDIYFENVGGEHLEAALEHMNSGGRVSGYNTPPSERPGIKNLPDIISKRINMQGSIVTNPEFGSAYYMEHQQSMQKWFAEGRVKAKLSVTDGIDNAAEGFVDFLEGKNFGKAVLKMK